MAELKRTLGIIALVAMAGVSGSNSEQPAEPAVVDAGTVDEVAVEPETAT